jgi:hypothetical protein
MQYAAQDFELILLGIKVFEKGIEKEQVLINIPAAINYRNEFFQWLHLKNLRDKKTNFLDFKL